MFWPTICRRASARGYPTARDAATAMGRPVGWRSDAGFFNTGTEGLHPADASQLIRK